MPSLKRIIAKARGTIRRYSESSLKAEQRRIEAKERKEKSEKQRNRRIKSRYGKALAARAKRREKTRETIKKAETSILSGLRSLGKAIDKHVNGPGRRTTRKTTTRRKTQSRKGR